MTPDDAATCPPRLAEDNGVGLSEAAKQQVLCDASTATVTLGDGGEPLNMRRKTRQPTPAQRRALLVRDGGCVFPGCAQRTWVDAHRVVEWEHGGPTDLANLAHNEYVPVARVVYSLPACIPVG